MADTDLPHNPPGGSTTGLLQNPPGHSSTGLPKKPPDGSTKSDLACYWKDMWQKLNIMRQMWQLCDVTLFSADNGMFMAHSPVLAASSEVFHNFFVSKTDNTVKELDGQSKLLIPNMSSDTLQITLDFIYGNMPDNPVDFDKLKEGSQHLGLHGALNFLNHTKGNFMPPSVCPMSRSKHIARLTNPLSNAEGDSDDADVQDKESQEAKSNLESVYLLNVPPIAKKIADQNIKNETSDETGYQSDTNVVDDAASALLYSEKPASLNALAEAKCPFSGLSGKNPHGENDPLLGDQGIDLLTEVSLVDLYPQLVKRKRGRPPKKLAKFLHEQQEMQNRDRQQRSKSKTPEAELETKVSSKNVAASAPERKPKNESKKRKLRGSGKSSHGAESGREDSEISSLKSDSDCEAQTENDNLGKISVKKKRQRVRRNIPIDEEAEKENESIRRQLKQVTDRGISKYQCLVDGCCYTNKKLDFLQSHMHHRHSIGRPSKLCPLCDHAYFSVMQVNTHIRRSHDRMPSEKCCGLVCPDCGLDFPTNAALHLHQIKTHAKGKLFTCDDCEFKSPRKKDMQSHMLAKHNKVAPGVRVFDCLYCEYRCLDRNRHMEHEAKHTGKQKYLCPICGKAYTTRRGMRTHIKYHSEERPHACTLCDAKFKVRAKLSDHIRLVHTQAGLKPYQCAYCNHQTALRGNCNQHIKKYHADMPVVVIDKLAHNRKYTRDYNYSNYRGQGIEQVRDVSAAAWASVGHSHDHHDTDASTDTVEGDEVASWNNGAAHYASQGETGQQALPSDEVDHGHNNGEDYHGNIHLEKDMTATEL